MKSHFGMMNQRVISLVCAVLIAGSSLATCLTCIEHKYLDWTELPEEYTQTERTREALLTVKVERSDKVIGIWFKILAASTRPGRDKRYIIIDLDLLSLRNPENELTNELMYRMLEICSIMHTGDVSLCPFAFYLVKYGNEKLCKRRMEAVRQVEEWKSEKAEQELDRFFADIFPLAAISKEGMLRVLKLLDFADSDFDLNAGVDHLMELEKSAHAGATSILFSFILGSCRNLMHGRKDAMRVIALADAFGCPSSYDSNRVLKLKEYSRLCLSLQRPDMKMRVRKHLESLLSA